MAATRVHGRKATVATTVKATVTDRRGKEGESVEGLTAKLVGALGEAGEVRWWRTRRRRPAAQVEEGSRFSRGGGSELELIRVGEAGEAGGAPGASSAEGDDDGRGDDEAAMTAAAWTQ